MPSSDKYVRNYTQEKSTSDARGEKPKRAARNRARLIVEKDLGTATVQGKDVDHKKPLRSGGSNARSNLRPKDPSANRSIDRKQRD